MKKVWFLNILNISLLFFIIIFFFLANSINAQTYFNPGIGYGYSGYGRSYVPSGLGISGFAPYSYSGYRGYPGYGYPGSFYGGYSGYNYPGSFYGPGYGSSYSGTYPSVPSGLMDILLVSSYDASDSQIRGIVRDFVTNTYIQPAIMHGYTPGVSPYSNSQTYYKYGGYPPISPSWPPIGMAYDPYNGSFYIPGQYRVGYPESYYR